MSKTTPEHIREMLKRAHPIEDAEGEHDWVHDYPSYRLEEVVIAEMWQPERYSLIEGRVDEYAALDTPAPPIVVIPDPERGLLILDGGHRVNAALRRGETSITAWVAER